MTGEALSPPATLALYSILTSCSAGVACASPVVTTARYCRYRDVPPTIPPEAGMVRYGVHVPSSGVVVFPVRTLIVSEPPAGTSAFHEIAPQGLVASWASNRRDRNTPEVTYGLMRNQSLTRLPPPRLKS